MEFYDIAYMDDGGTIGLPARAAVLKDTTILWHLQSECVLKLTKGSIVDVSRLELIIDDMMFNYTYNGRQVLYIDLRDVLRSKLRHPKPTNNVITSGTPINNFAIQLYDGNEQQIGVTSFALQLSDSVGIIAAGLYSSLYYSLPDTFYFPQQWQNYTPLPLYAKTNRTAKTLKYYNSSGVMISTGTAVIEGDTIGRALRAGDAFVCSFDNNNEQVEEARVMLESCMTDKMLLKWWSLTDGCWKARVAKIKNSNITSNEKDTFVNLFDKRNNKLSYYGYSVVFENLSARDLHYYGDIITASEVYLIDTVMSPIGEVLQQLPCRIENNTLEGVLWGNGAKDVELFVKITETSEI